MNIIPAIDLQNGRCVRLTQGDFETPTIYEADPQVQAKTFAQAGAAWLHVVDLDGARAGAPRQFRLIADIAQNARLNVQVGGGLRNAASIEQLFDVGIARAVVGSLAVKDPATVGAWIKRFGPARIVPAFDIKLDGEGTPELLTHGWQSGSRQSLWHILELYAATGLTTVLCTDVSRDGMLQGPNFALYQEMRQRWPNLNIQASGGVAQSTDLAQLAALGVADVIVGKAIYEGRIELAAAFREARHAG